MDSKSLGKKLKTLREARFPNRSDFIRAVNARGVKLDHGAVEDVEEGIKPRWLRVDRMKAWVEACGSTLSDFFSELEPPVDKEKSLVQISVPRENKKLHDKLEELLATKPFKEADKIHDPANWIAGNLDGFHRAYVLNRPDRSKR